MNAISSYLKQHKLYGRRKFKHNCKMPKTLVVISIYNEQLRNSRPCNDCIYVMRMYNIKKVIYSTGNPDKPYSIENVESMPLFYQTRRNR